MSGSLKAFVKAPRYLVRDWRISAQARLLLIVLRSYCYRGDECWPSAKTLAKDIGCSERQLFRYLYELARIPLIQRRRKDPSNPKSPTVYTLLDKDAESRLQRLAEKGRKLKSGSLTPMSATSLTPMSDEVEEPLKGTVCDGYRSVDSTSVVQETPENVIRMPEQTKRRRNKAL